MVEPYYKDFLYLYKKLNLLGHANDLYTCSFSPLDHLNLFILYLAITSR